MAHLVEGLVDAVLQVLGEAVVDVDQLLDVGEHHGELLGRQQPGALHGAVELLLDDAKVFAVTRLRVEELQNGLLALGPQLGAALAHALAPLLGGAVPLAAVRARPLGLPGSGRGRGSLPGAGQPGSDAAVHSLHLGPSASAVAAGLAVLLLSLVAEAHHAAVGAQAADGTPAVLPGPGHTQTDLPLVPWGFRASADGGWCWMERTEVIGAQKISREKHRMRDNSQK